MWLDVDALGGAHLVSAQKSCAWLGLDLQVRRLLGGGGVEVERRWSRVGGERISGRSEVEELEKRSTLRRG
jgi:hypothetical protein